MNRIVNLGSGRSYREGAPVEWEQGPIVVSQQYDEPFDVGEQTALAVETYGAMGLIKPRNRQRATDAIGPRMQQLSDALVVDGFDPSTERIIPFSPINLRRGFGIAGLVAAFNNLHTRADIQVPEIDFTAEDWKTYTPKQLNNRLNPGIRPVGGRIGHARAMLCNGDPMMDAAWRYSTTGFFFTDRTAEGQIDSVRASIARHDKDHPNTDLALATTSDVIVVSAQQFVLGKPLLDNSAEANTQLDRVVVGGIKSIGTIRSRPGGQLKVHHTHGDNNPRQGVRLSVGPKPLCRTLWHV